MEKGGVPIYPVWALGALMFLTWAIAMVASYRDEKPP